MVLFIDDELEVPVCSSDVRRVLGLPSGDLPVTGTMDEDRSIALVRFRRMYGLPSTQKLPGISEHESFVVATADPEDVAGKAKFLCSFICSVVANVLAPKGRYSSVHPRIYPAAVDPLNSAKYDWCTFVLNELRDSAAKAQKNASDYSTITMYGCLLLLQIMYMDNLLVSRYLVPADLTPRAPLYTNPVQLSILRMGSSYNKLDKCKSFFHNLVAQYVWKTNVGLTASGTRQLVIKECDASYVPMSQSVQLSMSCDAPEKAVPHEDGHYERPDSHMLDMLNTEMHDVVATVTAGNNSADSSMSGTSYKGDEHDICLQSSEQSSTLQTMRHDSIVGAIDEHGQMRVLDFTAKALSVVDHLGRKHSFVVLCPPLGGVKIAMKKIHRLCCFDSELQFYDSKDISQILSAGALAKWISSTSQSTEFYRNWVEHCEHRLVAVEGIQIKNELFKTQEIGHSICELAFRGFGRMETKMCHKRTKGPCRHFLSPDWAVHALCGEPPREELYKELFVGKHIGYDPLQCRMFTAIVEKDGTYACYTWDFDACRLSILDPGVQNNNVHDYCTKHYGIAIIFMGI